MMLEVGLCQSLCNTLMLVNRMIDFAKPPTAEQKILIEDVQQFFGILTEKCFGFVGELPVLWCETIFLG